MLSFKFSCQEEPDGVLMVCRCVRSVIRDSRQEWELTTCEALLPFMCQIQVIAALVPN